ncbi:MAG: SDR family NAD(P)-dependent oxidoreductase, partial [Ornithinibacter sp.]
ERVTDLAAEIDGEAVACDVTVDDDVARLAEAAGSAVHVLVNNAGGALGLEPVSSGDVELWRQMYETNVLGTLKVTKALLPALIAAGGEGIIVNVGSIAGLLAYEGGGGYTVAKHGVHVMTETLRLELVDQPVRITEIAPGMVRTEEFSLTRFGGDRERADRVYEGVPGPLVADDVAEAVLWMATRPAHVNVDLLVIKPRAQAAPHKVHRVTDPGS